MGRSREIWLSLWVSYSVITSREERKGKCLGCFGKLTIKIVVVIEVFRINH